jgi:hypothetical protein
MRFTLLIITVLLITFNSFAQDIIPTPCVTNNYLITNARNFYDTGGPGGDSCSNGAAGNYINAGCVTEIILYSPGNNLEVNFDFLSMYNTVQAWDWIVIYDGGSPSAPILFDNRGGDGTPSNYPNFGCTSFNIPTFCSTGDSILIHFHATSVVNRAGWEGVVSVCNVTPVDLKEFKGNCDRLTWTTYTELNNSHFIIEYSKDGVIWDEMVTINGNGTTVEPKTYSTEIQTLDLTTYYRLKQVDFDGTSTTYKTIALECLHRTEKKIRAVYNTLGQYIGDELPNETGVYIILFEDGSSEKRVTQYR